MSQGTYMQNMVRFGWKNISFMAIPRFNKSKKYATIFKNTIRRGDLAARFGGDEFVVILPNCGKKNAILIGEKLHKAIADENIPSQEQQPLGNLTCTFGIATFPEDADTKELLLKKADDCLYEGKDRGRNIVITAAPK